VPARLGSAAEIAAVIALAGGAELAGGICMHGGFFLGPRDFYQALREMPRAERERIGMDSVRCINRIDAPSLREAQRLHARFVNTGMMVTLSGAVISDGLESGEVVSGVGGQYNFVAQAHELPARARSSASAPRAGNKTYVRTSCRTDTPRSHATCATSWSPGTAPWIFAGAATRDHPGAARHRRFAFSPSCCRPRGTRADRPDFKSGRATQPSRRIAGRWVRGASAAIGLSAGDRFPPEEVALGGSLKDIKA
jgi:hypothetical protein